MKKICCALFACLVGLLAVSCEKQEEEQQAISTNIFKLEFSPFTDENGTKVYLHYTDAQSTLLYEDGDKLRIYNQRGEGGDFVIKYRTISDGLTPQVDADGWYALGSASIEGSEFYAAFADGYKDNRYILTGTGPNYSFNFSNTHGSSSYNKILLAGSSRDGRPILTMKPACAIIRIKKTSGGDFNWVKVGFEANRIPMSGTISAETGKVTAKTQWMSGVSSNDINSGDFMMMKRQHESEMENYFYVAVPIVGDNITTNLYFAWNKDGQTTQYKISNATLYRGMVYTVGSERQSPFATEGFSKYYYFVNSSNGFVCFSAGNLQAQKYMDGWQQKIKWQFAPTQYSMVGSNNSSYINGTGHWFDLFGYGTSGYGSYVPNMTSTTSTDYPGSNLDANTDWGRKNSSNPGIYYGSVKVTSVPWRTLTSAEWSYLLGRSGKCGYATVAGQKGIVLFPDLNKESTAWDRETELPSGPEFTPGYSNSNFTVNNYTATQWATLEMAGAIFLPAAGMRSGTTVTEANINGYYWSSTFGFNDDDFDYYSNAVSFSTTNPTIGYTNNMNSNGYSVRLVVQCW